MCTYQLSAQKWLFRMFAVSIVDSLFQSMILDVENKLNSGYSMIEINFPSGWLNDACCRFDQQLMAACLSRSILFTDEVF